MSKILGLSWNWCKSACVQEYLFDQNQNIYKGEKQCTEIKCRNLIHCITVKKVQNKVCTVTQGSWERNYPKFFFELIYFEFEHRSFKKIENKFICSFIYSCISKFYFFSNSILYIFAETRESSNIEVSVFGSLS